MKALSIKKVLLIVLALGIVVMGSGLAYALTVHELPGTGWSDYDRGFGEWTNTSQSDFQAGVLNNVDINSSPGDVKIGTSSSWLDGYYYRKSITIAHSDGVYSNIGGTITTDGLYTVHTFTGSGTFTPCKTGTVSVQAWGGGGGGGVVAGSGGGGGGGGAYAATSGVAVTASTGYAVVVGAGGAADTAAGGGDSSFNTNTVVADGGLGTTNANRALGGIVANCVGTLRYKGGDGGNGNNTGDIGGGGGGAAGPDGAGLNGVAAAGGVGGNGGRGDNNLGGVGGSGGNGGVGGNGGENLLLGGGGGGGGDNGFRGGNGGRNGGGGGGGEVAGGGAGASGLVIVRCLTSDFLSDNSQTNYQMQLTVSNLSGVSSGSTVYLNGASRSWPNDIRFTTSSGTVLLDYWIESYDSTTATVWVEFDAIPAHPNDGSFYIYYGNADAADVSNGANVFLFFDDFSGDLSKWNTHVADGTVAINSSVGYSAPCLEIGGGYTTGSPYGFTAIGTDASYSTFQDGIIEADIYSAIDALPEIIFRGVYASNTGYKGRWDCRAGTETPWMTLPYNGWTGFGTAVTRFGLANQWQKAKLVINGSTFSIYSNGALQSTETDSTYAGPGEIGVSNHYGSYVLFDNIRVRKYASPEPAWGGWGVEETPSYSMTNGTIASDVFNTGHAGARWDLLAWDNASVAGTSVTFEARVSDFQFVSTNITLSWQSVSNNPNLLGQYEQWRATLSTSNGSVTPVLNEVRALYSW